MATNTKQRKSVSKNIQQNGDYVCSMCGEHYTKQDNNFPASQSPLYINNNAKLPVCYNCIESLFDKYAAELGGERNAIKRLCMKFDIYYSDALFDTVRNSRVSKTLIRSYVSRSGMIQYKGKTFDTSLKEMAGDDAFKFDELNEDDIPREVLERFGRGFTPEDYIFLQNEYEDWVSRYECETKAQETIFVNLSYAQLNVRKAQKSGVKVAEAIKTFQDLLGTANIKPSQRESAILADQNTFGTLIKKWEDEKPIPEPDPRFKDCDGIVRYISIFFLGHLCKMLGLKNTYSRMYEEEMNKYRVERPEYAEDDEALFDAVFGKSLEKEDDENDS